MARILKRRGLYEVRGGTREPRPRDPGMTAQQAISTASSALKLGTQVASLIGKIPVKDARAKKLEELEASKQVTMTQQMELENQKKVAKANAMQRTPDALVRAQQQAEEDLQGRKAKIAAARQAPGFAAAAEAGGLSLKEMTDITERISGLPNAAFARKQVVDGVVSETVLSGQDISARGRSPKGIVYGLQGPYGDPHIKGPRAVTARPGFAMPPGLTREDITRPNAAILKEAITFELEDVVPTPSLPESEIVLSAPSERRFVDNPSLAASEIDKRFTALQYMIPASVDEQLVRIREMERLRDMKTSLLGRGTNASGFAALQGDLEASERKLKEAKDAVESFESAQKGMFEGRQRVFSEREKALNADLEKIQSQMPDLKRTLADIIADARFAKTEKEKRKLMKEAVSTINARNVKGLVFGVDELKLKALEKVLKVMPKDLSKKDLEKILNAQELRAGRKQKREQSAEAWPDRLKKIQADSAYKQFKQQEQAAHNKLDLGIKKQRLSNMQLKELKTKADMAEKKDHRRRTNADRKDMTDYRGAVSATVASWKHNRRVYREQITKALLASNKLRELRADRPAEYEDRYAKWKSDLSKQMAIFNTYGGKTLERNQKKLKAISHNLKIFQQKAGFELKNKDAEDFE